MQDLIDRLDAELDHGPEPTFDLAATMAAGRTVVRRRRLAAGGAVLATALVIAGVAAIGGGRDDSARDGNVAGTPSASASSPAPDPWPADLRDEPLRRTDAGWQVNPDAEVLERDDFVASDGTRSEIFHLRFQGTELYAMGEEDGGYGAASIDASQGLTLRAWAQTQVEDEGIVPADDDLVAIGDDSRLTARNGTRIVAQRPDPGLGDRFAAPGTPTAAAEVVADGVTWFLAVRAVPGGTEAIPYRKSDAVATLDAFLEHARKQYSTNDEGGSEGLR